MSKRTKRIGRFSIDGKISDQIRKENKKGNEEWIKFQAQKEKGIQITPHFYKGQPEKNHLDVYNDGKKIDIVPAPHLKSAGVVLNMKTGEMNILPSILVLEDKVYSTNKEKLAYEYVRRVKRL